MSAKTTRVHLEIRLAKGARVNELVLDHERVTVQAVLLRMSKEEWAKDLFETKDGNTTLINGFLLVLDNRMVQKWELEDTFVNDEAELKFVQVVPGG